MSEIMKKRTGRGRARGRLRGRGPALILGANLFRYRGERALALFASALPTTGAFLAR